MYNYCYYFPTLKTVGDWKASGEALYGMSFEPPEWNGERTLGMFMWHKPFMISTDAGKVCCSPIFFRTNATMR